MVTIFSRKYIKISKETSYDKYTEHTLQKILIFLPKTEKKLKYLNSKMNFK